MSQMSFGDRLPLPLMALVTQMSGGYRRPEHIQYIAELKRQMAKGKK